MVTKSTANKKAKEKLAKGKEEYRVTRPCYRCGTYLNSVEETLAHTAQVCAGKQREKAAKAAAAAKAKISK